ncbi:MAG TPA: ribosome biogenesis factor YjgA [Methylophilaceae bacterium]|nr:ribosome biogenesis factor YjgA [Methylophilaceae bacterium]HQR60026.1 ribosome biogenesis factor YjgA [Methylophilaceae bacterium]
MNPSDEITENEPLSKTKRKAAMLALQELGEELIALSSARLAQLDLPEVLMDAVKETQRTTAHGALARQKQYIGRLMREIDTTAIADQLQRWKGTHQEENAHFHQLEKLRTRLLEDDSALADYLHRHPQTDSQQLRTLIRNARREAAAGKPPKSSRELFKLLRATAGEAQNR